jgi:hypothetical protein
MKRSTIAALALASGCGRGDDRPAPNPFAPPPPPLIDAGSPCGVTILATVDGTWVGNRAGAHRFAARCGAVPDIDAVAHELARLRDAAGNCLVETQAAAGPGTTYWDLLAALDALYVAGLPRHDLAPTDALGFPASPAADDLLPPACPPPPGPPPDARPPGAPVPLEAAFGVPLFGGRARAGSEVELVVVVVTVDAKTISWTTPSSEKGGRPHGSIAELLHGLPPPAADLVVLVSADRELPAATVVPVARALAKAGYDKVGLSLAPP